MNIERILELITHCELPMAQKGLLKGFIIRANVAEEMSNGDRKLIEKISKCVVDEILLSTESIMLYTVRDKTEWGIKYPYRFIYKDKNGNWIASHTVCSSVDIAYLTYLGEKNLGGNTQFVDFTIKMLGMQPEQ